MVGDTVRTPIILETIKKVMGKLNIIKSINITKFSNNN